MSQDVVSFSFSGGHRSQRALRQLLLPLHHHLVAEVLMENALHGLVECETGPGQPVAEDEMLQCHLGVNLLHIVDVQCNAAVLTGSTEPVHVIDVFLLEQEVDLALVAELLELSVSDQVEVLVHVVFIQVDDGEEVELHLVQLERVEVVVQVLVDDADLVAKLIELLGLVCLHRSVFLKLLMHVFVHLMRVLALGGVLPVLVHLDAEGMHVKSLLRDAVQSLLVSHALDQQEVGDLDSFLDSEDKRVELGLLFAAVADQ